MESVGVVQGIQAVLLAECRSRIDEGVMLDILDEFDHALGRNGNVDSDEKNGTQANQICETTLIRI